jgi:hypothetical protein
VGEHRNRPGSVVTPTSAKIFKFFCLAFGQLWPAQMIDHISYLQRQPYPNDRLRKVCHSSDMNAKALVGDTY